MNVQKQQRGRATFIATTLYARREYNLLWAKTKGA